MQSPLVAEVATREQLKAQARSVLEEVASSLRAPEKASWTQEDQLSKTIGISRARKNVHATESLRAVVALSEAALSVVVDNLSHSQDSARELATVALAIQKSIMERVMNASIAYGNYLLSKLHESHADERRRISRELHDRMAHSIMVVFRSLELYELFRDDEPARARHELEFAKDMAQEALKSARDLSRELRNSSAEEGLEVSVSDLLRTSVPQNVRSWVSVKGDESLIAPDVRDELFLVIREAIRNSTTHSGAGRIRVELCISPNSVTATVQDDGRGFESEEEAVRKKGAGLASMRERTSLLGGALSVVSFPGKGTKVDAFMPLPGNRL
jgi:signal transduction histidine kinase